MAFLATIDYETDDAFLVRILLVMDLAQLVASALLADYQFIEGDVDWPPLRMVATVDRENVLVLATVTEDSRRNISLGFPSQVVALAFRALLTQKNLRKKN